MTSRCGPVLPVSRADFHRPVTFTHWTRPTRQYSYLYDYRRNYYSDVLDYLDLKDLGYETEIPLPQTWAERAMRTYTKRYRLQAIEKSNTDKELLYTIRDRNTRSYRYYPSIVSLRRFT